MKKHLLPVCSAVCLLMLSGCGKRALVGTKAAESADTRAYAARSWVDFSGGEMPWDSSLTLELPEFPDVVFTWTPGTVTARAGAEETVLFAGMPVWNVFLCDLTQDGRPEFCATVSFGSGMVDNHIVVYDYSANATYTLWDRGEYDYALTLGNDGWPLVIKTAYGGGHAGAGNLILLTDYDTGERYLDMVTY